MESLKALFSNGPLTYEQFVEAAQAAKMNLVNLADGGYVSQAKFDDKVSGLTQQVSQLTEQIGQRDADMATLKGALEAAQADAGKLPGVQQSLTDLQTKYANDKAKFEKSMADQRYEFAVRERANGLKFSSTAAKKAFLSEAIGKKFKMDGDNLQGYDEFLNQYKTDDPGAFVLDTPPADPKPDTPRITLPGKHEKPAGAHRSLAELMQLKNENPDMEISFTD